MKIPLVLALLALSLQLSTAEDIKTLTGQEYKNATITRAEPDGIVLMFSAGIVKIPFTELAPEWRKKYGYKPQEAQTYSAQVQQAAAEREAFVAAEKERQRQFNLSGLSATPAEVAHYTRAHGKPVAASAGDAAATLDRAAPSGSLGLARVFADYSRNQLNADQQYKGRTFSMGGKIKAVTSEESGPMVELQVDNDVANVGWVYAHFREGESSGLQQLHEGNHITFVGTIGGLRNYTLTIKNCYLSR